MLYNTGNKTYDVYLEGYGLIQSNFRPGSNTTQYLTINQEYGSTQTSTASQKLSTLYAGAEKSGQVGKILSQRTLRTTSC